jgi:hypothetical protein
MVLLANQISYNHRTLLQFSSWRCNWLSLVKAMEDWVYVVTLLVQRQRMPAYYLGVTTGSLKISR